MRDNLSKGARRRRRRKTSSCGKGDVKNTEKRERERTTYDSALLAKYKRRKIWSKHYNTKYHKLEPKNNPYGKNR